MKTKISQMDRRKFLVLGAGGIAALAHYKGGGLGLLTPARADELELPSSCLLSAEQVLGPYYLEKNLLRRNITEDKVGLPLRLKIAITDATTCQPLPHAAVDIWHCDAEGLYSGFTEVSQEMPPPGGGFPGGRPPGPPPEFGGRPPGGPGGPGGPPAARVTDDYTFLRGVQITDEQGRVEFETIYPGWYIGRTIHIHFRVRVADGKNGEVLKGHSCHTGQFFIDDALTAQVAQRPEYRMTNTPYTQLTEDHIFLDQHGAEFMLRMSGNLATGLVGEVNVGVNPKIVSKI